MSAGPPDPPASERDAMIDAVRELGEQYGYDRVVIMAFRDSNEAEGPSKCLGVPWGRNPAQFGLALSVLGRAVESVLTLAGSQQVYKHSGGN